MELKVVGRLKEKVINRYADILKYRDGNKNAVIEIILFCDYSEYEISKNTLFNEIKANSNIYYCQLLLKEISQEYMIKLESVPFGWKTVCKFELLNSQCLKIFDSLTEINEWGESDTFFILS